MCLSDIWNAGVKKDLRLCGSLNKEGHFEHEHIAYLAAWANLAEINCEKLLFPSVCHQDISPGKYLIL